MTYREAYRKAHSYLQMREVPDADIDALRLLEYACGISRASYYARQEEEAEHFDRFWLLIEERGKRIPLQHLIGEEYFCGYPFYVTEDVLIPRQDTELLVSSALEVLKPGMCVLDLCTGSGCILLSLMKMAEERYPELLNSGNAGMHPTLCSGKTQQKWVGTDISRRALAVASKNAKRLGVEPLLICADLMGERPAPEEMRFDLIVSNPPYIPSAEIASLEAEVRDHDPQIALDGGADGLRFYRRIADAAGILLKDNGMLMLEIGYDQGRPVSQLLESGGFSEVEVRKDLGGRDRVVIGRMTSGCFAG